MNIAKISANGQISLPKEVRKILGVEPGDKVIFIQNKKGEMVIKYADWIGEMYHE